MTDIFSKKRFHFTPRPNHRLQHAPQAAPKTLPFSEKISNRRKKCPKNTRLTIINVAFSFQSLLVGVRRLSGSGCIFLLCRVERHQLLPRSSYGTKRLVSSSVTIHAENTRCGYGEMCRSLMRLQSRRLPGLEVGQKGYEHDRVHRSFHIILHPILQCDFW